MTEAQLIFRTEERPDLGVLSIDLVPTSEEAEDTNLSGLTDRDITLLRAFLDHATFRLSRELVRRARDQGRSPTA